MVDLKNTSLKVTIITGILLPILLFKNFKFFVIDFIIFLISAVIAKTSKVIMNEKIMDDEYKNRFKD